MVGLKLTIQILAIVIAAIGALIGVYTRWYPEDERTGRGVRGRTGADIQRAINRVGEPYFWTDRKLAVVAATMIIVGAAMAILAQVLGN